MTRWATLLLVLAACRKEPPRPIPAVSCLDRELAARGLNSFGDPEGTMYAGGTPLFNERTGASISREQYVFSHHPELASACGSDAGR
ncbi:MAG: hypothetical protein ACM3PC_07380 [Deltaproteobacteria bacterium]